MSNAPEKIKKQELSTKYKALSIEYWVLSTEYRVLSTEYWVLSIEYRVLSTEYWVLTTKEWSPLGGLSFFL
jgi:hypothetical protein